MVTNRDIQIIKENLHKKKPGLFNRQITDPKSKLFRQMETVNKRLDTKSTRRCFFCAGYHERTIPYNFEVCFDCSSKYMEANHKVFKKSYSQKNIDCDWCKKKIKEWTFKFSINPFLCFGCFDKTMKYGKEYKKERRAKIRVKRKA